MDKRFNDLIIELSERLAQEVLIFLETKLYEDEDISKVIDLILSSNLTCAFALMHCVAKGNEKVEQKVDEFESKLKDYIETLPMIKNVEWVNNE